MAAAACKGLTQPILTHLLTDYHSTPLYQVINHALSSPFNTTKFKLLFSNVTEEDILMRENIDALAKKHPQNLEVVYLLDKPKPDWKGVRHPVKSTAMLSASGPTGYISTDVIKKYVSPPTSERIMIMVCGMKISLYQYP